MDNSPQYKVQITPSFKEIDADAWDGLIAVGKQGQANPFIKHAYLSALEESGSACVETGWLGQHLLLMDEQDNLIGALPCYLKNHSQGEYVFDHAWADALERSGGRYYPKLQCSVPFTPATGPRFLCAPNQNIKAVRALLANALKQLCERHEVSSAHITFLPKDEWQGLEDQDFLLRVDQQFHWQNQNYDTFDHFLDSLSSRKRKNIRKERKTAQGVEGIEFEWLQGSQITEQIWDAFYEFYLDTGSRKWGRPYLTREFYSLIGKKMPEHIVLAMVKRDGKYIAGAINFIGDNCLYGRHWGCSEFHGALHFEVCYYQAIEYAITHSLDRVEAGAQGEHKLARGYMPVPTHSAHWIENPGLRNAVENYLRGERQHVKMESEILTEHGPYKNTDKE